MAETPKYSSNNHWMNILSIDVKEYGISREKIMFELEKEGIETRPIWFPNHLQKPYIDCQTYDIRYAEKLVEDSLCLPSSSSLLSNDIELILSKIKNIN